ncbi:MAG TPA: glutamyl-tRNA amidotransferase [Methylococcaceae bacterium]|jgi:uncharacterized protein YqeY|nr:glutamyl-tRNA amidotransferase [Methylococcaceae bacterium]
MSELKLRLQSDMKTAMKAGEKDRLGVIRLILAAIKQREVDERIELDDAAVLAVLDKMVKQRRESVSQYEAANREDLAAVERAEITVIQSYLPAPLGDDEIEALIAAAIEETGAAGPSGMGKVMAVLREPMQGRADMTVVSARVKQQLGV